MTTLSPEDIAQRTGRPFSRAMSSAKNWRFGRHGSFSVSPDDAVWYDHETGEGGHLDQLFGEHERRNPVYRKAAAPKPAAARRWSEKAEVIWRETVPLKGTPAEAYFRNRSCALPTGEDVRYEPRARHWKAKQRAPAILSRVTDFATGEPLTVHHTLITEDGRKSPLEPRKLMLPGHQKRGGVIRLTDDADVTLGLGLAEGIETALSVMAAGWSPCWSAIDAGNLGALPVVPGIEVLTIFADADMAGMKATIMLAERWRDAGREVRIATPPIPGTDWADHG